MGVKPRTVLRHAGLSEAFDPPIFAAFCSPNLTTAVSRIARFKALLGPLALETSRPAGDLQITLRCDDEAALPRSLVIAELAFFVYLGRRGTRRSIQPLEVTAPGDYRALGALTDYFGLPVTAGPRISVRIAADDAQRPFLTVNAGMWQVFESELQRRLRNEGTNYQVELGAVRERLAKHYLTRTTISSGEIAFLLGFNDPNSFYRAFQGWTGKTPETLRTSVSTGVVS